MLGLKLSSEDVGLASRLVHVDGALVDSFLFFAFDDLLRFAVYDWHNGELLLGLGLFEAATAIPASTFDLETEDVSTVAILLLGQVIGLPVHLLLHFCQDVKLVELDRVSPRRDLLDSGQEGLWVVEPVNEGDVRFLSGILFPAIQLFKSLLDVIKP